jgi:type IV secretion system protein VirD4
MTRPRPTSNSDWPMFALAGLCALMMLLWLAAATAARLTGHATPHPEFAGVIRSLRRPDDPSWAWTQPMPGPVTYWAVTAVIVIAAVTIVMALWRLARADTRRRTSDPRLLPGLADRTEIRRAAGRKALLRKASIVRPSLNRARTNDIGYRLGTAQSLAVWTSVEESMVILGPPRSGKGLHLVIPMILDAPGAVITTSTRPDNLTVTLTQRAQHGPVAVFDPQHLAPGVSSLLRWSPIRGCEHPQTAMIRARALAAGTAKGIDGGDFWQAQTEGVLRGFLHAAALADRTAADLYKWSLSPVTAGEATRVLSSASGATDGWADALDSAINADSRTRDSIWTGVRTALACLADPRVLDAVTPRGGESFDPAEFIANTGSLYLIGTASGAGAAAGLISAYLEDVLEVARGVAATSTDARLDPPLALVLDEVANYPLPSLPSLMSDGGGTGITTIAVLQSLAQARSKWGEHDGAAVWDAAIVKIILGGGSNARDLADLSALIGDRDENTTSETRDAAGNRSYSTSPRRMPIMDTGRLRMLPFGTGVLMLRSAHPILLDLHPWSKRRDASTLRADRAETEELIRASAASRR